MSGLDKYMGSNNHYNDSKISNDVYDMPIFSQLNPSTAEASFIQSTSLRTERFLKNN